ncbi:hypothetical protein D3C86_1953990 [compost metagenome]
MHDLFEELLFLLIVYRFNRREDFRFIADLAGGSFERLYIFWEARPAIAAARINEVIANTRIRSYAFADCFDIRAKMFC